jgi:hypothetical protein
MGMADPNVTISRFAAHQIRRRGGLVYVWATDVTPTWQWILASLRQPDGVSFVASVNVRGVEVRLSDTVSGWGIGRGIAVGYRLLPRPAVVAWSLDGAYVSG